MTKIILYLSSIIMFSFMLISWCYTEYAPINVIDDVKPFRKDAEDDSMIMMILSSKNEQPQMNSSSMNEKRRRRRNLSSSSSLSLSLSSPLLPLYSSSSSSSLSSSLSSLSSVISSSLSINQKFYHRSLRSPDSLKDDQLAIIAMPKENSHIVSTSETVHHTTSSSSHEDVDSTKYFTILTKNNHTIRYTKDSICSGCRYVYTTSNEANEAAITCWSEIERMLSFHNNNISMLEAAILISTLYPNNCHRCNPNSCTDDDKKYYRPDDMISNQYIEYARTHFLKSIDSNDRIPLNILTSEEELNTFLQDPYNLYPHREYFAEFNPSITHLPKSQIPKQLSLLLGANDTDASYYLASYRVSTGHHCFLWDADVELRNNEPRLLKGNNYLGIAILDVNLNIVLDTVVDIQGVLIPNIPGMKSDHLFQDARLFTLNNQLYLGSFTKLYPIWLVPPSNTTNESKEIVKIPYYMTAEQKVNQKFDDNENNNDLLNVYIHRIGYCSNDRKYQLQGKNYNYFYDISQQRIVAEIHPMGNKEYFDTTSCQLSHQDVDFILPNETIPLDSFGTTDEIILSQNHQMKLPFSSNRGSYCCLSMNESQYYYPNYTNYTTLLVGVSHIRSEKQLSPTSFHVNGYMYFNNFYAMEPVAPYNIVARSGRFCLGYPKYDDINNTFNNNEVPFQDPRQEEQFDIGTEVYDCAKMHFITGMSEALHDPNQVVISYGVDDCYSRFIMISKKHILSLLFNI